MTGGIVEKDGVSITTTALTLLIIGPMLKPLRVVMLIRLLIYLKLCVISDGLLRPILSRLI